VFTADPVVLRTLVVAASVGAFAGAVLLRLREHAGEVDLEAEIAARFRDEARFEDRAAELEAQAEAAEEQVKRLERRLLAQRAQITRIESENARLLRDRARIAAEQAAREAEEIRRREVAARGSRPTPTAYLKASAALRGLERRAAVGQAQRIAAQAAAPKQNEAHLSVPQQGGAQQAVAAHGGPQQEHFVQAPGGVVPTAPAVSVMPAAHPAAAASGMPAGATAPGGAPAPLPSALDALAASTGAGTSAARQHPGQESAPVPGRGATPQAQAAPAWARAALPPMRPASAVLPTSLIRPARQSRDLLRKDAGSSGTFNFFSRQEAAISRDLGDLADVVGDEAAAAQQLYAGDPVAAEAGVGGLPDPVHESAEGTAESEQGEQPGLVDLTADDETEPIDVRVLRAI